MFCKKCGKQLPDNAEFCSACGTKVFHVKPSLDEKDKKHDTSVPEADNNSYGASKNFEKAEKRETSYVETPSINERHLQRADNKTTGELGNDKVTFNKRSVFIGGVILAFLAVVVVVLLFKNIFSSKESSVAEDEKKGLPVSEDLMATSTYVYDNGDPKVTYFIYDENRNLICQYGADDYSPTLEYHTYDDQGQEILMQFLLLIDYDEQVEALGLKDELTSSACLVETDGAGRRTHVNSLTSNWHNYYEYNDKNQLVREEIIDGDNGKGNSYVITYEYDKEGNKTKETKSFDTGDVYTDEFEYDSNGRLIKDAGYTCEYDNAGHMVKKYRSKATWTYTYISDPKDSWKYRDEVNKVFNLNEVEADAKRLVSKYYGTSESDSFVEKNADTLNEKSVDQEDKSEASANVQEEQPYELVDEWGLDGANEGPLPNNIFEEIKGTYYSEINGLWIYINSPSQMVWESGSYRSTNYIEGCDSTSNALLIYTYEDGNPIILSVFRTDEDMYMNTLEGGDWDYEKTHVHASLERISKAIVQNYLIPDSSSRLITEADLAGLSKEELRIARNEIVARHGRRFKDAELQAYFDSQTWYVGAIDPDVFDRSVEISDIEKQNMEFIKKYEK